ncbi:MAG: hypothetical protein SP1CHLAM54_08080 [Chlamydiia bacterium]|nr:hypothetical protein [Chlamydiia bacterium]MCH9615714.1 hypothetical protein [Chlamydiia bacterium]MCH9628883.1 hypothetical protein [Chlamydiia bacterium]
MDQGDSKHFDVLIIGGGATGLGCAVDAQSRGLSVLLLEKYDFAKGTSSRSTKLIHGGLRYLEQGNLSLVFEALHERGYLLQNAPHLVTPLPFIIPAYKWWERPLYSLGLKLYDYLAGSFNIENSTHLSAKDVMEKMPTLQTEGLRGGTRFFDAQFDDARFAISLMRTCQNLGGVIKNYTPVTNLIKEEGVVCGVETSVGSFYAKKIINATGIFTDELRNLDNPLTDPIMKPSQGIHLVLPKKFLGSDEALVIPKTKDKRLLFMVPWHDHVLLGTTDLPVDFPVIEPKAKEREIDFILKNAAPYLNLPPTREDILSVFAGLRPLVRESGKLTRKLARTHKIFVSESGLITITGGKWTTYRRMGEEAIDCAFPNTKSTTKSLHLHGFRGSDKDHFEKGSRLHADLPYYEGDVIYAVRYEMAKTLDDVLSRRTRALFLNVKAAIEIAPRVAKIMADELKVESTWIQKELNTFEEISKFYTP